MSGWDEALDRYWAIVSKVIAMTPGERIQLKRWERENVNGSTITTSDYPGFAGIAPVAPPRTEKPRTPKTKIPSDLRWEVWERDDFTCQECGRRHHLAIDHIKPESKGGATASYNLQTLCRRCNSTKGAQMP